MKAFRFPLESVLVLRTQLQEQAFQKWAQAMQELRRAKEEGQRLLAELNAWMDVRRNQQEGTVLAGDLSRNQRSAHVFFSLWTEHLKLEQLFEQRAQQALNTWQEARKKQEILERLKNRSRLRWSQESDREEQKISDERATLLAFQKTRASRGRTLQHA